MNKKIEINSKDYNGLEDLKKELESTKVVYEKEMEEKPKKPLEFKIVENKAPIKKKYAMIFFYDKGITDEIYFDFIPSGLVLNRHYHIDDMYGNTVIDDREGL